MTDELCPDIYFSKTRNCVDPKALATYGVFLRHDSICAVEQAITFLRRNTLASANVDDIKLAIKLHYSEGALVPAESPLFSYTAKLRDVVELETQMLQHVGFSCISAFNAYMMARVCPNIPFLDMAARHCAPGGMIEACAYGASIGSKTAQMSGAKGFVGSSLDLTAPYYGASAGLGTMPHVLVSYAGSTLNAVKMFIEHNPNDKFVVALVDYFGQEITDSLRVAEWWKLSSNPIHTLGKTLGIRLDTHGGRFAEDLDYDRSVEIVGEWIHKKGKWSIVREIMGDDAFDIADDPIRDNVAKILFGTGVSAANIINMRRVLDNAGHKDVKIVASSGFNLRKCRIMAKVNAPIDMIGTGSFLPETLSESFATCDCYEINGAFGVKVGREHIFKNL